MGHLKARAQFAVVRHGACPALPRARQQASFRAFVHQPARAEMGGEEQLIELRAPVLAPSGLAAGTEPPALGQRHLVLRAAPYRDADA